MKIKIKYKHGLYGGAVKLQVFGDKNLLTEIRQGEVKEVEISQDCKSIYAKMDWAETNRVDAREVCELDEGFIEISGFFTLNILKVFGIGGIPIKLSLKRQRINLYGMSKEELEAYGRELGVEIDRRKSVTNLINDLKAVEGHWK
ncbi:MAG: hypothetical protein O3A49_05495 [Candidatus Marinimicrobia bacterium]|jgi:hypothetical protein|nr:hypothetical protein [Candidatus Neomarinimicrobiota bacterium]MDA1364110.1 hypothetical protein [Candidatus Neomarinimicrobiota bacterium]